MGAVAALSLTDIERLAEHAARSGCYGDVKSPQTGKVDPDKLEALKGECVLRILRGSELGLGPTQALDAWHNMKGKLVLKSDLHVAVCLKRPEVCAAFVLTSDPSDRERASYRVQRVGGEPKDFAFTLADAKAAGLLSNNTWQKYPAAMLRARCGAIASRAMFPDIVGGLYDEGEGEEIAGSRGGRGGRYKADAAPTGAPQLPPAAPPAEGAEVEGEALPAGYMTPAEALAAVEACETSRALDDLNVKLRAAKGVSGWTPADVASIRIARDERAAKLISEGK